MAKIKGLTIKFTPSTSTDVVTNKVYIEKSPTAVSYTSPSYDVGNVPVGGFIVVDLKNLIPNVDGLYNIGVAAVDDVGNESDMKVKTDVPLDFIAPTVTGDITIV